MVYRTVLLRSVGEGEMLVVSFGVTLGWGGGKRKGRRGRRRYIHSLPARRQQECVWRAACHALTPTTPRATGMCISGASGGNHAVTGWAGLEAGTWPVSPPRTLYSETLQRWLK
ncbi:hypothetical protein E2C01_070512 [Portunus trituberculatus]|uniref:Uncharacterized protein n=1 Tax=Portunus trituberculatus TaxID=210409 RepID=A0A5B7I3N6_PORTR|nr:hypothetical protein [Portunus trituberculatus]